MRHDPMQEWLTPHGIS
jgi:hypothetical protein